MEEELQALTLKSLAKLGLRGKLEIACTVKEGDLSVADYVAKFGREPFEERDERWGVARELAKGVVKAARGKDGYTPWALLDAIIASPSCEDELAPRFQEYAAAFKRKEQLVWSRGSRAALGVLVGKEPIVNASEEAVEEAIHEAQSDAEIAAEDASDGAVDLDYTEHVEWVALQRVRAAFERLERIYRDGVPASLIWLAALTHAEFPDQVYTAKDGHTWFKEVKRE
jgi:hypothetical protein